MIIENLENYYGRLSEDVVSYLQANVEKLDDDKQGEFFNWLKENHKKNKGVPTVSVMSRAYTSVTGAITRRYYWCVCKECDGEYGYGLPMCPHCYDNGKESLFYAVRVSDMKPPFKVVRYNKRYIGDGSEQTCYSCPNRELSYCPHFGQPDWTCQDSEFRQCKCVGCCMKTRKDNAEFVKRMREKDKKF